jgi:signal transduction histidine kinase
MTAITRYSSQLESAQARIQTLEADLMRRERGVTDELVISLAQELRTPMTSIAGYTDLLLSEMLGILGEKQRDFLQRVKANVERMDTFLDLIIQLTTSGEAVGETSVEPVEVQTVLETAVSTVITQIREKNLHLDMQIQPDMPQLAVNREALQQILSNLLGNACQVSDYNSRVGISATINELAVPPDNGHTAEPITFMHLSVTDSGGGIQIDDRARVFDPQYQADHPLIDGIGDTGAGLAIARTLTEANGGRVWLESNMNEGSTLSVLFPIAPELPATDTIENQTDTQ